MTKVEFEDIQNAWAEIEVLKDRHKLFLDFLNSHTVPTDFPSKLGLLDHGLAVTCFDFTAEATPRVVKIATQGFMIEYVFIIKEQEAKIEVWRFYLTAEGRIVESADGGGSICSAENKYIAEEICSRVLLGALRSAIFAPCPR